MKNEDFLDLLNEIDEKYIESANKRLEELHQYKGPEFGKALKPQVIRLERTEKRRVPFRTGAFAAVAAALVCAVTAGVFVKLSKPPSVSPSSSGVTLSESSHISEPSVPETTSSEPVSSDSTSSEPTSSEPPFTDGKLKKLYEAMDRYDFALEINGRNKEAIYSEPIPKTDSENEIAIRFACGRECEGRDLTIAFYLYDEIYGTTKGRIATLHFTARNYTQWFTVPYKWNELKEGDKCVMQIIPDDRDYTSHVVVKGLVLP